MFKQRHWCEERVQGLAIAQNHLPVCRPKVGSELNAVSTSQEQLHTVLNEGMKLKDIELPDSQNQSIYNYRRVCPILGTTDRHLTHRYNLRRLVSPAFVFTLGP